MVSPQHADVDGKVWSNNQDVHTMYRLDVKTGQYEDLGPSKDPRGKQISAYGMPTDLRNNVYQLEFGGAFAEVQHVVELHLCIAVSIASGRVVRRTQ